VTARWVAIAGNTLFLALDGPGEWADILHALTRPDHYYHWRLATGLLIKNALVVGTIVGLLYKRSVGYVCLMTESVQSIAMRCGAFAVSGQYLINLLVPAADIVFRLFCIGHFLSWNRKEGTLAKT
jgi:hypothetical protein